MGCCTRPGKAEATRCAGKTNQEKSGYHPYFANDALAEFNASISEIVTEVSQHSQNTMTSVHCHPNKGGWSPKMFPVGSIFSWTGCMVQSWSSILLHEHFFASKFSAQGLCVHANTNSRQTTLSLDRFNILLSFMLVGWYWEQVQDCVLSWPSPQTGAVGTRQHAVEIAHGVAPCEADLILLVQQRLGSIPPRLSFHIVRGGISIFSICDSRALIKSKQRS